MSQYPGQPVPGPYGPQQPPWPAPPMMVAGPYPLPAYVQPRRQRPAVIAMAATMTVTASLQWICALSFFWLVATAGAAGLSTTDVEGGIYHLLHRFHLGMIEGLALPLYGFPTLAFFLGFVVLAPRTWARLALTLTGVAALAWSAWWLRNDFVWWLPGAAYIGFVCLILWTPGATEWYRRRGA
ncbi:MAG: hypothetical protein QM650_06245 [Microlunatus sp.]